MALLRHLEDLLGWPRNSRMPSLLVIGEPGIGKTQINAKFGRDHPPHFDAERGRRVMPVVSVQVPAATSDRLFWTAMLRAVDAVFPPRLRIPTEPATCTDLKAATYSDPMPAGVPI